MLNGGPPKLSRGSLGAVMNSPGRRHSPSLGGCGRWALLNCKAFLASTLPVGGDSLAARRRLSLLSALELKSFVSGRSPGASARCVAASAQGRQALRQ